MKAKIYRLAKSSTQSGRAKLNKWILECENYNAKNPEALMGWTSSEGTDHQVMLEFNTQEDAVTFAQQKGWEYDILPDQRRKVKPRNFGDNFKYRAPEEENMKSA